VTTVDELIGLISKEGQTHTNTSFNTPDIQKDESHDSRRLHAFHMTCQIRILGIQWNDFITNRAVSDSTNLPSVLSTIAARRHSIFGHIRRLPDRTPAHMTLKLAVNTRSGDTPHHGVNRPAGRPRTAWMSQIVRDSGLSADDAWAAAEDRSTWRALRPTAGYAQQ